MAPSAIQLAASKQTLPYGSSDGDVARQLVMGRWRSSLSSGLRAALACTIVGLVSLYAPAALRRHITFPAFSYVVTVILVTDATLGTALRGAVSALHGSLMGAAPSVVALWLAHRTGAAESVVATVAVVALTAFAVALPAESSVGPVAKRIALGQAIIIYVAKFQQGVALVHPANVVACTALGVAAALLAVLLPWPRMATREARDKSRAYRVLAAERVRVMADAFFFAAAEECSSCRRRWRMAACMSEAKRLASASTALLNRINAIKEDLQWERAVAAAVDDDTKSSIEMPLAGMQIALEIMMMQQAAAAEDMVGLVMAMRDQIRLALLTPNNKHTPSNKLPTTTNHDQQEQLAPFLFIFSLYQLHRRLCGGTAAAAIPNAKQKQVAPAATTTTTDDDLDKSDEEEEVVEQVGQDDDPSSQATAGEEDHCCRATTTTTKHHQQQQAWWPRWRQLVAAAKCGFSLGLAVLLGLLFSNDHGFWSGLIVATTMTAGRESTWRVAVARAHGTALGSIYGVLGCLLMSQQQQLLTMDLRFLALLPWMVLAAFLRRSRAYGPAGGVAAALSVVIIMGRRYDEAPMAFTMARLVETFIGISCAVLADLVFQPGARPSVQAREQLARCVAAALLAGGDEPPLQQELALLSKYVAEAGSEPTYLWLPPFPAACYDKIQASLGRMAQLLQLYHQARSSSSSSMYHHQQQVDTNGAITILQLQLQPSLSHCLRMLSMEAKPIDLEAGTIDQGVGCSCCRHIQDQDDEANLLLLRLDENDDSVQQPEERLLLVCSLASIALCMGQILKEAQHLEAHILDLNSLQLTCSTH